MRMRITMERSVKWKFIQDRAIKLVLKLLADPKRNPNTINREHCTIEWVQNYHLI